MRSLIYTAMLILAFFIAKTIYYSPSYDSGQKLPEINIELIDGGHLTNADLMGNYVLIDFWGSWCGPCRREAPELVNLYNDYNSTLNPNVNFQILSIGIERKESRWRRAIEKDNLFWKWHYSSFKRFKDPLAKKFGVREIPTKFLVDPEGNIIAVNLGFDEIRSVLDNYSN